MFVAKFDNDHRLYGPFVNYEDAQAFLDTHNKGFGSISRIVSPGEVR